MVFYCFRLFVSDKLERLSNCVHGLTTLLFPLSWQHIFVPVLPPHLLDYLGSPVPFVVGVHKASRAAPLRVICCCTARRPPPAARVRSSLPPQAARRVYLQDCPSLSPARCMFVVFVSAAAKLTCLHGVGVLCVHVCVWCVWCVPVSRCSPLPGHAGPIHRAHCQDGGVCRCGL